MMRSIAGSGKVARTRLLSSTPTPTRAAVFAIASEVVEYDSVSKIEVGGLTSSSFITHCPSTEFRGLSTAEFGAAAAALRVGALSRVIVSSPNPLLAARLWWLFISYGLPAHVLEGPWLTDPGGERENRLRERNRDKTIEGDARKGGVWTPKPVVGAVVTTAEVLSAVARGVQLIDVRTPAEYAGIDLRSNKRGGHIPGALNMPWTDLLDKDTGEWRGQSGLREVFEKAGIDVSRPAIVICQAGIRATAGVLALRALGAPLAGNYVGAMQEYLSDPSLPVISGTK